MQECPLTSISSGRECYEGSDTAGPSEDSNMAAQGKDRGITFRKNEGEQQLEGAF